MKVIRGLYLEDYSEQFRQIGQILELVWVRNDKLRSLGELKWQSLDYVDSPDKAIAALRERGHDYTLFFADLLFHRVHGNHTSEMIPTGLDAVTVATAEYPRIVVAAISVGEQVPRLAGRIEHSFRRLGGDVFFTKDWVLTEDDREHVYSEMGRRIEDALRKKGWFTKVIPAIDFRHDEGNYALRAELETIGESTLRCLLQELAPDCVDFDIAHVDPGVSGASVFKFIGWNRKPFAGTHRHMFVKVSKDADSLHRELRGIPKPGTFPSGTCPEPVRDTVVEENGRFAIGYSFLQEAVTLQNWLLDENPPSEEVCRFLDELFKRLTNLYGSCTAETSVTTLDVVCPREPFVIRALASLDELWPLVERHLTDQNPDSLVVRSFVQHKKIVSRFPDSIPFGAILCDCHGDLHSRNILVRLDDNQPHLVDFSERGERHGASDFAQLCANLLIRAWDHGAESHEWGNLKQWRQVLHQWLLSDDTSAEVNGRNNAVWSCLLWVRQNFELIWGTIHANGVSLWQFQLAVAAEFVKAAGQLDICAPKRAFALVGAHDILTRLQSVIPERAK